MLPGETDKDEPGEAMMSQMENMLKKVSQSALLALALATALPGVANADTYGCVSKVTDGAQKLLLAETKALAGCAISFAKGAVSNLIPCAAAFANTTVKGAQDKLVADTTAACGTTLPAFGLSSLTAPPQLAIGHSVDLYKDLFGQNPNATTLKDINGLKCQDTLRKAMGSCQDTRVKEFEACLKTASKNGSFASVAAISACLGAGGNEEPDAKGKIDKACFSAIRDKVIPVCTSLGVQTASALPGCNATTAEGAATCMKQRSLCRICTLANAMYGTTKDCDLSDDGDDANSSCPEPLACGDGVVDGNEACDDGNASNGDGCSSTCTIETGWSCGDTGCTPVHGDGAIKGQPHLSQQLTARRLLLEQYDRSRLRLQRPAQHLRRRLRQRPPARLRAVRRRQQDECRRLLLHLHDRIRIRLQRCPEQLPRQELRRHLPGLPRGVRTGQLRQR